MLEYVNNNLNSNEGETEGSGNEARENTQQNPSVGLIVALEVSSNVEALDYQKNLVAELMKVIPPIPPVPLKNTPKFDRLANGVARHNHKVYERKLELAELEDWIRGMEKIFPVVEVPEVKKVNIRTFYIAGEVDIQWSTMTDQFQGFELTWAIFLEELKAKFIWSQFNERTRRNSRS